MERTDIWYGASEHFTSLSFHLSLLMMAWLVFTTFHEDGMDTWDGSWFNENWDWVIFLHLSLFYSPTFT